MVSATDIPKSQRFAIALPSTWVAAGIVVAYVLLALWWGVVVPIGEGPDEPGHFNYALFVARVGRLPVQSEGAGEVPGEGHQPPLAYWLMQPALLWLPPAEQTLEMGPNPQFWPAGDDANAYLRSSRDIWPYSGIGRAWHLARAISALLCGATVALTYAVARRCLPRQPGIALGAAALVAFNPQFVFAGALVSNDALLFALSAALLLLCLMIVEAAGAPPRYRLALAAGAGLLLGLLLVTKQSAVALVPLPFLALALGWWRAHAALTPGPSPVASDGRGAGGEGRLRAAEALLVAGITPVIAGWWYARNLRLYGDLFGLGTFQETFASGGNAIAFHGWTAGLWELFRSSWGMFGWLTVPLYAGLHTALLWFCVLALIGLLAAASRRRQSRWRVPTAVAGKCRSGVCLDRGLRGYRRAGRLAGTLSVPGDRGAGHRPGNRARRDFAAAQRVVDACRAAGARLCNGAGRHDRPALSGLRYAGTARRLGQYPRAAVAAVEARRRAPQRRLSRARRYRRNAGCNADLACPGTARRRLSDVCPSRRRRRQCCRREQRSSEKWALSDVVVGTRRLDRAEPATIAGRCTCRQVRAVRRPVGPSRRPDSAGCRRRRNRYKLAACDR